MFHIHVPIYMSQYICPIYMSHIHSEEKSNVASFLIIVALLYVPYMSHMCPIYIPVRRLRSAVGHRRWTAYMSYVPNMSHVCPIYIPVRRLRSAVGHRRWTAAPTPSHTVANTCIYMGHIRDIWHIRGIRQVVNSRALFPRSLYSAKNKNQKKNLLRNPGSLKNALLRQMFTSMRFERTLPPLHDTLPPLRDTLSPTAVYRRGID
jgi:hypothetical protein